MYGWRAAVREGGEVAEDRKIRKLLGSLGWRRSWRGARGPAPPAVWPDVAGQQQQTVAAGFQKSRGSNCSSLTQTCHWGEESEGINFSPGEDCVAQITSSEKVPPAAAPCLHTAITQIKGDYQLLGNFSTGAVALRRS